VTGQGGNSPYTRADVEMGILGERQQAEFDALYSEAKEVLSQSANQLKALAEQLRRAHAAELAATGQLARDGAARHSTEERLAADRSLLARLEVVHRELEQNWRFLERGSRNNGGDTARTVDEPDLTMRSSGVALQLLEAREQERSIVAAELHDGPAQGLANAIFQVDILDRTLRTDPDAAPVELLGLRDELDSELERLRGFIHQLHPSLQADDGLYPAIDELASRLVRDSHIQTEVSLAAPVELLDDPHARAVLRVAQEALRNVRKHAKASHVRVSTFVEPAPDAGASPARWILEIADNGRGFPVDEVLDQTSKRHFGLRFMRERAQLIGARLEIVSNPAAGTTVRLALEPAKRS
jgi:signal transduction histidine kinase